MLKLPKELILDVKRWRCGGDGNNAHGKGDTNLHNEKHYECCLGQFARQAGCSIKDIKEKTDPYKLTKYIRGLSVRDKIDNLYNSMFSRKAISINDDPDTTVQEKIKKLKSLCSKFKRKLTIKNLPKGLQK